MIEQEITLSDILLAREQRVAIQNALHSEYKAPVISFTMNIAGPVKVTALSHRAFLWGMDQLRLGFLQNKMKVLKEFSRHLPTGDEGYFAVDVPAERVKALCVELEENGPGPGRFFDMDVIGPDGKKLERGRERYCIVCGREGRGCASRRLHSVEELQQATKSGLELALIRLDGLFQLPGLRRRAGSVLGGMLAYRSVRRGRRPRRPVRFDDRRGNRQQATGNRGRGDGSFDSVSAFSARAPVGPCGSCRRAMLEGTSHAFWRLALCSGR